MKDYLKLQFTMLSRKLKDFGISPLIGMLIILSAFIGFSILLFRMIAFAPYVYLILSLALTAKLSERNRNDFLKLCFKSKNYLLIRIVENLIVSFPFFIFLICRNYFLFAVILIVLILLLAVNSFKTSFNLIIPTPFSKKPFEFTVGFRNTFYLIFIAYCLTFIAITVDNFNLGIFSLALIFILVFGFYIRAENEYFVWNSNFKPKQFLFEKLKTGMIFTTLLCLPILISLSIFYSDNLSAIILVFSFAFVLLMTVILAKYAAYPDEINLPEVIILALGITLPPLLLVFIPYFYTKANTKLKFYLP